MKRSLYAIACAVFVLPCLTQMTFAWQSARELAAQSMEECQRGRSAKARDIRLAHFERAHALAKQSVALDDQLPNAHYSLFCSLGERLRIDGENLSAIFGFQQMMAELDRTLALDPNHLNALSSKATFLVRLPSLLGGDLSKGEALLRRVIREDPTSINARLTLATILADRGEYPEAISLTTKALNFSEETGQKDFIKKSKQTLVQIQSKYSTLD